MITIEQEPLSRQKLEQRARDGSVVILGGRKKVAVGAGTRTKVNANIGLSPGSSTIKDELEKARVALKHGADTIMDLSTGARLKDSLKTLTKKIDAPIGTVPTYAVSSLGAGARPDDLLKAFEEQCKLGAHFMTIHSGITLKTVKKLGVKKRAIPITSKGGAFLAKWMLENGEENPWLQAFDSLLETARRYDVALSLGDALRPGTIHDANDYFQNAELYELGRQTKIARKAKVGIIIEGPGHVPINRIRENIELEKRVCGNAPYYLLGPLVTDAAVGYDHIAGAIGGALAASYGADFLCYVTPSEHIGLPDLDDVREGTIASKIAAHAADICKGVADGRDRIVTDARYNLRWDELQKFALSEKSERRLKKNRSKSPCTMCGEMCAIKRCQTTF